MSPGESLKQLMAIQPLGALLARFLSSVTAKILFTLFSSKRVWRGELIDYQSLT